MKTTIHYVRKPDDEFYHPDCPVLYRQHDTITRLEDCPFPLQTDSFTVLLFGESITIPSDKPERDGHTRRFAVVRYTKACGHTVEQRIPFIEGVQTFESYGTVYTGESYSITDWQRRIESFRSGLCDVCDMVRHCLQVYAWGDGPHSRKAVMARADLLLNANYQNWTEFVPRSEIERRLNLTGYGKNKIAD